MRVDYIEVQNFRGIEKWCRDFRPQVNYIQDSDKLLSIAVAASAFFGGVSGRPMSLSRERDDVQIWAEGRVGGRFVPWIMEKRKWAGRKALTEAVEEVVRDEGSPLPLVALYVEGSPKAVSTIEKPTKFASYGHSLRVLRARLKHWRYLRLERRYYGEEDPGIIQVFLDTVSKIYFGPPGMITSEDFKTFLIRDNPSKIKLGTLREFDIVVDLAYKTTMAVIHLGFNIERVHGVVVIDRVLEPYMIQRLLTTLPNVQFFVKQKLDT